MIYFTSDLHFGHNKPFLYEPRGFKTIQDHDELVLKSINDTVQEDDELWILGDLMLNNNEHGLKMLNRIYCKNIYVILGNHDSSARIGLYKNNVPNIKFASYAEPLVYKRYRFFLSHYPTQTGNFDYDKPLSCRTINLCGHTHSQDCYEHLRNGQLSYNVVYDAHKRPVSVEKIIGDVYSFINSL